MKKEEVQIRIQEIEKHQQQLTANFNMLEGGKQECLYWLKEIEAKEIEIKDIEIPEVVLE